MTSKKHALDYDTDYDSDNGGINDRAGKRIKLDTLFKNLKLDENKPAGSSSNGKEKEYFLPNFKSPLGGGIFKTKPAPRSYTSSHLDSFINDRIVNHFQNIITSGLKVIPWYNYRFLVLYRLQKWFVKLFNRFIRKYNTKNNSSIRPFKNHEQIIQLVRDGLLSWNDLRNIINEENKLEIKRLSLKEEKRQAKKDDKMIEEETETFKELGYNYWDNLKFDKDLDMLDANMMDEPELGQLAEENDVPMDEEGTDSGRVEANYGSYYHKE
ncbi:hypothetical protein CANMA_001624 [Candida margitis]|uniref:uncharacterized protein n=1 Tax=Candida margitis TaxID=1775924 RepID=UPI002226987D|nr:uncharacterized protein CANMA_001624 [Candida margitis]KAI5969304.1 hypothetical protein CANMA_001624 [Candida margitis]